MEELPEAFVVRDPGTGDEQVVALWERLFIGRECAGIATRQRLLLSDEAISRNHLEIRLDDERNEALLVDTSTNGTRLNGTRIVRAVPVVLHPGDRIVVGNQVLEFRSERYTGVGGGEQRQTVRHISLTRMAMVVGDIISFSTISEYTDDHQLMDNIGSLYDQLRKVLEAHGGTLNNYVGDAFFAIWEVQNDALVAEQALRFALEAQECVTRVAPSLALRDPEGRPMQMGWGAALGGTAVSSLTGVLTSVLGDAANVAFRLSGLSGRDGRAPVMATRSLRDAAGDRFVFGTPEEVKVKGRSTPEMVFPVLQ
jgi:adenylate cyclase